jgi:hypothetical protein
MRAAPEPLALAALLSTAACTGEQVSAGTGLAEPLRVESGQFLSGALPGLPAPDASADAGPGIDPQVTDINIPNTAIEQGEQGLTISGHVTPEAQTVALRFSDLGTGYWVVPVSGPDPTDNNLLTWQLAADFGRELRPGFHDLVFAAVDAKGSSGTQSALTVCVDTPVPDNLNVCVPRRAPPAAVLSLDWDTAVNLDLVVQTPSGAIIGAAPSPASAADAPTAPAGKPNGVLDRDSNANCVIDNIDREDLIWQATPPTGRYHVWVDLFSACHQPGVSFTVSLWLAQAQPDGTKRLVRQQPPVAVGVLQASQATGGSSRGLFVGDFVLQ